MRNTTLFTVATFCVVLSMSLCAHGEIIVEVTPTGSPAAGLNSFTLTAVATQGETIQAFAGINVTGGVYDITPFNSDPMTHAGMWAEPGVFGNSEWSASDTYVMIDLGDPAVVVGALGNPLGETNDGSDPAGQGPLFQPGFDNFAATIGVGDFGLQGPTDQFTLTPAAAGERIEFLQVVQPTGTTSYLTGLMIFDSTGAGTPIADMAIPEPSTFAILGIALVGLGAFLRKR